MTRPIKFLSASEAAGRLGVTAKALRLYEQRGLISPRRTAAGYRAYGPDEMLRASEIVALRALGLSLAQVALVLEGDRRSLESALALHEASLESRIRELVDSTHKVREIRANLAGGQCPAKEGLAHLRSIPTRLRMALELPWPWGGERFELHDVRSINYIVGSLGSGKTRLAMRIAETLPGAAFLGLERLTDAAAIAARLQADPALKSRIDQTLAWLVDEGATRSMALTVLLVGLEEEGPATLVVDMVEQDLDQATQEVLIAYLRQSTRAGARTLFLMTRSTSILDLPKVGPDESIILCPANHSPPMLVTPYPGAPGYEAVATCLASPKVRARVACCPQAA